MLKRVLLHLTIYVSLLIQIMYNQFMVYTLQLLLLSDAVSYLHLLLFVGKEVGDFKF